MIILPAVLGLICWPSPKSLDQRKARMRRSKFPRMWSWQLGGTETHLLRTWGNQQTQRQGAESVLEQYRAGWPEQFHSRADTPLPSVVWHLIGSCQASTSTNIAHSDSHPEAPSFSSPDAAPHSPPHSPALGPKVARRLLRWGRPCCIPGKWGEPLVFKPPLRDFNLLDLCSIGKW